MQTFCVEGALGLPLAHLELHTQGGLTERWLATHLLVAVNDGLLVAVRNAAPACFDAATFAASCYATFTLCQALGLS